MRKIFKVLWSPTFLLVSSAIVLAVITVLVLPQARAEEGCELIDNQQQCIVVEGEVGEDLCSNIEEVQTVIPSGYSLDDKTGDCVEDPPSQVLGESTTVANPAPQQVLGASVGK